MLGTVNIQIANKEEIKNLMYSHNDAEAIQNNTDLNTLLTPGKYRLLTDSYTILNAPPDLDLGNFVMVVELFKTDVENKYSILQRINTPYGNIVTREISIEGDTADFSKWKINELQETNNLAIDVSNTSIGGEVVIPHSLYGDIPFIAIGKDHDADNSVTLLSRDIIRLLAFDAKEASNSNSDRKSNGNNRYKYSNLLQWMNSDKAAGSWYTAQHSADAAPSTSVVSYNPYSNVDGFLRGFSSDVVNQMITVDKTTALNTVTDGGGSEVVSSKVFLLSTTEVGLANENNIAEGKIYEYFSNNNVNEQRLAYPSTYCLNNAGGYTNTNFASGKPWHWWLRTPYSGNSGTVRGVYTSGALYNSSAYYGNIGLRLALSLKTT